MAINYREKKPIESLDDYVFSYWKTDNDTGADCHYTVLPDGGIELVTSILPGVMRTDLFGISTGMLDITIPDKAVFFGIRFKLLAVEYLFRTTLPTNSVQVLERGLGDIDLQPETSLATFASSIDTQLQKQSGMLVVDPRKRKLFNIVHSARGGISVQQLALETGWSTRQINRYFGSTFGLPLKEYLDQLAFYSSLLEIGEGNLYPQSHYYDQSHFIRKSRKHTGTTPKQLYLERDIRFVQVGRYTEE
jgi:AraC-like DNA-binding protein